LLAGAAALVLLAAFAALRLNGPARIGAGYQAKILCSEIFVAGRDGADVLARDFEGISPVLNYTQKKIYSDEKSVRVSLFGLGASEAVYLGESGCTLVSPGDYILSLHTAEMTTEFQSPPTARPDSDETIERIDYGAVNTILDNAMGDVESGHRSFVILVDGRLVAERYADGFTANTRFLSWSMAKSVLATLVGAAAGQGLVFVDDPAPVAEWSETPKASITWNDLLRMQTGLAFEEDYATTNSDVNNMLWRSAEMGAVAAMQEQLHAPGEFWDYSSGTSNLLARTLQNALAERDVDLQTFARETVFNPIGASSFVLETDMAGNFVGSSFVYATARDWARLGQLYLQNGQWNGTPVLSPAWIDYTKKPTAASDGQYGAHFWLNHDGADGRERYLMDLSEDMYFMAGHEGQYVYILPTKNAIIVRTGITRGIEPIEVVAPVITALYDAIGNTQD